MVKGDDMLPREGLIARVGRFDQIAGVALGQYIDGVERHSRYADIRSGGGIDLRVMIDRGFDPGQLFVDGLPVAWRSPNGFRSPYLHRAEDEAGAGLLRSIDGLMLTCGLDHVRGAAEGPAVHFGPRRSVVHYPLHGRISTTPAQLTGYGETWAGNDCTLWCEGLVRQSMLYGEALVLRRRIEVPFRGSSVKLLDQVVNEGFCRTPHLLMYHLNFGYPLLDVDSELMLPRRLLPHVAPDARERFSKQAPPSRDRAPDEVLDMPIDDEQGEISCALVNHRLGLGLGIEICFDTSYLRHLQIWRNLSPGMYVLAIEPATNAAKPRAQLDEQDAVRYLEPGEATQYAVTIKAHRGLDALKELRSRMEGR